MGQSSCVLIRFGLCWVDSYFPNDIFILKKKKKKLQKQVNGNILGENELYLMPLVNILPILTVLNMTKILYSHEFMMKKFSILI